MVLFSSLWLPINFSFFLQEKLEENTLLLKFPLIRFNCFFQLFCFPLLIFLKLISNFFKLNLNYLKFFSIWREKKLKDTPVERPLF